MAELLSSLHSSGAQERTVTAPFGEVPVSMFARCTAFDGLVHGWDLSRATGLPYEPPDGLIAEVEAPPEASRLEQIVAFSGRQIPRT